MKHRIFRDLVQNMGFRAFGIESHWVSGEKANQYVQTCEGSPEEALDLHITVWQSAELRELLQFMCEWNQAHPDLLGAVLRIVSSGHRSAEATL